MLHVIIGHNFLKMAYITKWSDIKCNDINSMTLSYLVGINDAPVY